MERWLDDIYKGRKRRSDEKLSQSHFIDNKSHVDWPGITARPPQTQVSNLQPELWRDTLYCHENCSCDIACASISVIMLIQNHHVIFHSFFKILILYLVYRCCSSSSCTIDNVFLRDVPLRLQGRTETILSQSSTTVS